MYLLTTLGCNGHLANTTSSRTRVDVEVDGLATADARERRKYVVLPGLPNVEPGDLLFRELKHQAEQALTHEGFIASAPGVADIAVFLSYGIGEPQIHYETITYPVFGVVPDGSYRVQTQSHTFGGTTYTSGSVQQGHQLAVTGHRTRTYTKIKYDRFLSLSAVDLGYYRTTSKIGEVWRTTVTSRGKSDDLRRIFPVMVAAAMRRLAVNTRGKVSVKIAEEHPRAQYLRGEIDLNQLRAKEARGR